jgi:hypothetical protein
VWLGVFAFAGCQPCAIGQLQQATWVVDWLSLSHTLEFVFGNKRVAADQTSEGAFLPVYLSVVFAETCGAAGRHARRRHKEVLVSAMIGFVWVLY